MEIKVEIFAKLVLSFIIPIQAGKGPEATGVPVQQQGTWPATPLNLGIQRKVTMTGQQQQGPGGTPQASRGGMGNTQQNRVCNKRALTFF